MKRKIPLIIAFMLALVIGIGAAGCNNLGSFSVKGRQDTDYVVQSNGGSAVTYGNYIYFINGYDDYTDETGKENDFGKVEKGAIYRAELETVGDPVYKNFNLGFGEVSLKTVNTARNTTTKLFVKATPTQILTGYEMNESNEYEKDADDEYIPIYDEVNYADVQRIGPKKVGTAGNTAGGIFIFDDYIFYASPYNKKDKNGHTQIERTDFYRAKLDGSKTELIYTSNSETSASAYMFYKFSGSYYLVLLDGTEVISVKMNRKIGDPLILCKDVLSVYLPNKGTYYAKDKEGNAMPENTVEDFVYILRSPTDKDPTTLGNVLEVKRPDGSNSHVIAASGVNAIIHGTSGGMFFYEVNGSFKYTNLAEITNGVMPKNYETGDAVGELSADIKKVSGSISFSLSAYDTYNFYSLSSQNPDDIFVLASNSTGFYKIDRVGNRRKLHDAAASIISTQDNFVYFTAAAGSSGSAYSNSLFRADLFVTDAAPEVIMGTDNVNPNATFTYDIIPGFVVYFSDIDTLALAYTFFKEFEDMSREGAFIGYRTSDDTIPEKDLYPVEDEE